MVCKKWDWYIGAGSTRLPRKVLTRLHIVQRKVRFDGGVRSPIEVEITGKKDHDEFDFLLTAQDEDALCPELQHRILNTYVESFYMSSLVPTHFLLGSIAAAAGNIVVDKMALDGVSFSAVANSEFWNFIFGFKGISELDMEKAVILPQQLNNVFLGRAALKGVSRLRLPRAYPLRSNYYNFDFSGLTTFLRNAPADKGAIQLSAFYPDFTLEQATEVPRFREVLRRPHAAIQVYVYKHKLDPQFRTLLQKIDGHEGAPPAKRSKYTRSTRLQVECEASSFRASTQSLPF
ncbi:hypothetical protein AAVH_08050 [Aphelenchoides avenae]|nr:hypothetical protein AAVH_08050 [Aphelenchus avenae]